MVHSSYTLVQGKRASCPQVQSSPNRGMEDPSPQALLESLPHLIVLPTEEVGGGLVTSSQ